MSIHLCSCTFTFIKSKKIICESNKDHLNISNKDSILKILLEEGWIISIGVRQKIFFNRLECEKPKFTVTLTWLFYIHLCFNKADKEIYWSHTRISVCSINAILMQLYNNKRRNNSLSIATVNGIFTQSGHFKAFRNELNNWCLWKLRNKNISRNCTERFRKDNKLKLSGIWTLS